MLATSTKQKPPVLQLTAAAEKQLANLLAQNTQALGMRLSLEKGGCAGVSYQLEYVLEAPQGEEVVATKAGKLFIPPAALLFLLGTRMDYRADKMAQGFVFDNPNQTDACGCGESVTLAPATSASE